MRKNVPVTEREYRFPSGQSLVSTTDLKGRITYCNPAFIAVSGYTRAELIGQPHNLIRHPDMPAEAFRDLWASVEAGRPWLAAVKNRRKDGDHYWVQANVTPLRAQGRPVGYLSVRTEATREQIEAAERLYRRMRAEADAARAVTRLRGGLVRREDVRGRVAAALRCGTSGQITLAFGTSVAAVSVAGAALPATPAGAFGVAAVACVAAGLGAWRVRRLTVQPVQRLLDVANRLASGDLTQRFEPRGEGLIGAFERALNQLNVNLRALVGDASAEVAGLRGTAGELAHGNHDLSRRTESQAASLQQTASSMEQITGTVRQSVEAARGVAGFARAANDVTQRGAEAVHGVGETMHGIRDTSERIGDILQVIEGIALQTNLLSLNAAVEAARAGEQGRGFAVVAGEVRGLAQRARVAAGEVRQLIHQSCGRVTAGAEQSDVARRTMDEALAAVRHMAALVGEIDAGAVEQLTGISQVNDAVSHIDGLTQQNAALVEQLAAAAKAVRGQAEAVAEALAIFRTEGGTPAH